MQKQSGVAVINLQTLRVNRIRENDPHQQHYIQNQKPQLLTNKVRRCGENRRCNNRCLCTCRTQLCKNGIAKRCIAETNVLRRRPTKKQVRSLQTLQTIGQFDRRNVTIAFAAGCCARGTDERKSLFQVFALSGGGTSSRTKVW